MVHRTGTTTACVKKLPQHSCSTVQTRDLDRILGPEEREGRAERTKLGGGRLSKDAPLGQPSGPSGTTCCLKLVSVGSSRGLAKPVVVQLLSCVRLFATPWTVACQASLFFTISQSLLKLMSIELLMTSNHFVLWRPLLLLPSVIPGIRVFSNESAPCIRWSKYWSFSFSICPSSEYSGLISFKIDWCALPAVQGTLKNLLQHHSLKTSILRCSALFMVQLSHPYITTGKIIALTIWAFVGKMMSLVFNMLSKIFKEQASFFFSFIFISWRLITLKYCSGFCHTLT